ncbi:putative F-box domain-containing protein [Rosa chinensis]|uniref:Putative F-box domain-containing protein n=1 Tax=Rosa chinensis TaxID=74649 RepID=A0A2P6PYA8_ROSCH|nr:F-box/kelch-repeat protein At3g06240 [Rosa chinensis]PRQ26918.1 putative F-box domain-containing protein [Rosa chinensis]
MAEGEGDDLVDDVVEIIILKLPLKSILKFRCVSKKLSCRISDYRFSRRHYKLARCQKTVNHRLIIISSSQMESLDLQAKSSSIRKLTCPFLELEQWRFLQVTLLVSSSGLVCASLDPHKNFILWNPSTTFFSKLPDPDLGGYFSEEEAEEVEFSVYHYGFGCVSATDDYKLLIWFRINSDFEELLIFSWKNQIWRAISGAPKWINRITQSQGALSNEKLHWHFDQNNGLYESHEEEDCILTFDLENEEFGKLSLPDFDDNDDHLEYANLLGVSCEGCLYVLHHMEDWFSSMTSASIWYMKEYGVTDSWSKLFDLKISHEPLEPITCLGPIFFMEKSSAYGYGNKFTEIKYQHQPQPHIDLLKRENLLDMIVCEETLSR